jgi:NADPH:quinone reductase-like Zn-dependent oxidoreductase
MRATWFESFGSARDVLQVGEKDEPEVGAGEVLVRIATSGINPSDVKKRAGSFPNLLDLGYVIPNSDGAGVIEAVGVRAQIRHRGGIRGHRRKPRATPSR